MLTKELLQDLERLIPNVMQADRHVLRSRFGRLSAKFKNLSDNHPQSLETLETDYLKLLEKAEVSKNKLERRKALQPRIVFPSELPISEHRDQILEALESHQVLIVSGETGSGKTTQLPKFCLEAGRGRLSLIHISEPTRPY